MSKLDRSWIFNRAGQIVRDRGTAPDCTCSMDIPHDHQENCEYAEWFNQAWNRAFDQAIQEEKDRYYREDTSMDMHSAHGPKVNGDR